MKRKRNRCASWCLALCMLLTTLQTPLLALAQGENEAQPTATQTQPAETPRASVDVKTVSYTHLDVYKRQLHGSTEDWKIINEKRMNGGKYKLNSFGIIAPKGTRYTGQWNEPETKYFN